MFYNIFTDLFIIQEEGDEEEKSLCEVWITPHVIMEGHGSRIRKWNAYNNENNKKSFQKKFWEKENVMYRFFVSLYSHDLLFLLYSQFTNKQHGHNIHTVNKRIDEPKIQKWKGNEWTQRWGYSLSVCYISSFDNVWLIMNDNDVAVEHSRHRLLFPWLSHGGACIIYRPLHGKNIWAQNSQQSRFHNYPFFSFKNMIVLK